MTVDPASTTRFRDDLSALSVGPAARSPLALAVSGGPDSMAMLALAHAAFPGAIMAATVDHGLRHESASEAAMVARCCDRWGIAHAILRPPGGWRPGSVQADARQLRYSLLADWAIGRNAAAMATAHHADDQAETFLMRAARGSGVAGLAGIRSAWLWERHRWHPDAAAVTENAALSVVRPLLKWRRDELAAIVRQASVPFATDPSNTDPAYDRARMRAWLADGKLDPVALGRAAAACAEADATIAALTDHFHRERCRESDADARSYDMTDLPREIRRRLTRDAIGHVRKISGLNEGAWNEAGNVEALLDALESGRGATLAGVQGSAKDSIWCFRPAPPRRTV